ncbi:hypothetical protein [Paenibacillus sp. ISL-20]|uniref:hypothetical protein n=1 Tax=Paenibacillus sp. ISL-20 TaxID=2819163 RepID=UPI001BEA7491|nr:hypothetical protein [Paenibacillus sp. ISL-20]
MLPKPFSKGTVSFCTLNIPWGNPGGGRDSYHPKMLTKVIVYAYTQLFSTIAETEKQEEHEQEDKTSPNSAGRPR